MLRHVRQRDRVPTVASLLRVLRPSSASAVRVRCRKQRYGSIRTAIASGTPAPFPLIPVAFSRACRSRNASGSPSNGFADGVGNSPLAGPGEDEDAEPTVRCSDIGRSEANPFRIEPEVGQVSEYSSKCPQNMPWVVSHTERAGFQVARCVCTEQSSHVLDHDPVGSVLFDGSGELRPEAGACAVGHATTSAGEADVLAGEPARADLSMRDGAEVDGAHVAVVVHVREVVREHLRRRGIELAEPRRLCVEHLVYRHAEATDTSEQLARAERGHRGTPDRVRTMEAATLWISLVAALGTGAAAIIARTSRADALAARDSAAKAEEAAVAAWQRAAKALEEANGIQLRIAEEGIARQRRTKRAEVGENISHLFSTECLRIGLGAPAIRDVAARREVMLDVTRSGEPAGFLLINLLEGIKGTVKSGDVPASSRAAMQVMELTREWIDDSDAFESAHRGDVTAESLAERASRLNESLAEVQERLGRPANDKAD